MKTYSKQNGFFSIGLGLAITALMGGTALAINATVSEDTPEAVQQQPAYEHDYTEVDGPESDV